MPSILFQVTHYNNKYFLTESLQLLSSRQPYPPKPSPAGPVTPSAFPAELSQSQQVSTACSHSHFSFLHSSIPAHFIKFFSSYVI